MTAVQHAHHAAVTRRPCAVCEHRIPLHLLMCGEHWRLVPADQQLAVYRALNRVRRRTATHRMGTERLSRDYEAARDAAIATVRALITPKGDC